LNIRGQVRDPSHSPISGVKVIAFDKDLRKEQLLGEQVTDQQGHYEIRYSFEQFSSGEKQNADLIFKLLDPAGRMLINFTAADRSGNLITTLNVMDDSGKPTTIFINYNAPAEQTIDFIVFPDSSTLSEYEQLTQELEPLLINIRLLGSNTLVYKLADLQKDEIDFLSGETGIERQKIESLVAAALLAKKADEIDHNSGMTLDAFYGLARTKGLTDFAGLARSSIANLREALIQAGGLQGNSKNKVIPPFESEDKLNQAVKSIHELATRIILATPHTNGKPTLAEVLTLSLPSNTQQTKLLQTFANHERTVKDFWNIIRQDPDFQEQGIVEKVQFTLQLGALTQNNLQLMNKMLNKFQYMRQVALSEEDELKSFIKDTVVSDVPADFPGDTPEEKIDLYTRSVIGVVQGAFPTETVANIISKVPDLHLDGFSSSVFALFLNRATDTTNVVPAGEEFDIGSTHIDTFIGKHGDKVIAGLNGGEVDKAKLIAQVKRAQRLFQVSTSPETFQVLMESKLNSANDMAKLPPISLIEKFGDKIDAHTIGLIHQRSIAASAAGLHMALQVYQSVTDAHPMVVGSGLKELPNWATLFGSMELCDCQHCSSVYSPAAYFVDLLEFLRKSSYNEQGWTPLDVLVGNYENPDPTNHLPGKRPDLVHIPLTCENTNTSIPYIDLVNEVLESYIVLGGYLDQSTAKDTGDSTSEELGSNPQYVEDKAYGEILRNAVFPISLPFDRSVEISRLYLSHLGTSRYDLMQAFDHNGGDVSVGVDNSNQLASEYLGILEKEFEILTGKEFNGQPSSSSLSSTSLSALYVYKDENLTPTLDFKPIFTPDQIMSGIAVVILQAKLNTDGVNLQLTLSGKYDKVTQDAVKKFQEKHGLTLNGIVDAADWKVLSSIKPDAVGALVARVSEFMNRTKLSYIELVELLKTRFVNPGRQALIKLENAGITNREVRTLIQSNFTNIDPVIQDKLTHAGLALDDVKQLIEQYPHTIVLYSEKADCDLSATLIQYLDGSSLDDGDLYKIHRFIRLWRKVGWTIPELDAALISLGYAGQIIDEDCIRKLAQIKKLQSDLNNVPPLIRLLSFWADIDTYGENSLYKNLFLNKARLKIDDAFQPKPDGTVLKDNNQMISNDTDHIPTLLAAFQMNAEDLGLILADLNKLDLKQTLLTLANVSSLYRYMELAKALKLKIKDLITLKTLYGRNPFEPKTPAAIVAFVDVVNQVRSSNFSIDDLNHLYRYIWDPNSGLAPSLEEVTLLVENLQGGLQKIYQDNNNLTPVSGTVDEFTRNKLAMIVDPVIADKTIQIVLGTGATYTTPLDTLPVGITFDPSIKNKIFYAQTEKKLNFAGLMTEAEKTLLISASADSNYQAAVNHLLEQSKLFIEQSESFIKNNLFGFLVFSDHPKTQLLNSSINFEGKPDAIAISQKFDYILKYLLPYLRDKLSRSLIKQTLSDSLKLDDNTVTQVLLEQALKSFTDPTKTKPAIADFLALVGDGLKAEYFNNATFTGNPAITRIDPTISFTWGKNFPDVLINQPRFSVRWTGKMLAQFDKTYTFYFRSNGSLKLWIDDGAVSADQPKIELRARQLYDIRVEYIREDPNVEAIVELQWSGSNSNSNSSSNQSTSKALISQTHLYSNSGTNFSSFDLQLKSYYLLHKVALLLNTLKISAKELVYLSLHPEDFAGTDPMDPTQKVSFDLNNLLPQDPSDFKPPVLFDQWRQLAKLFALKGSLPKSEIGLFDIF